jgi:hypothetical protein
VNFRGCESDERDEETEVEEDIDERGILKHPPTTNRNTIETSKRNRFSQNVNDDQGLHRNIDIGTPKSLSHRAPYDAHSHTTNGIVEEITIDFGDE